MTLKHSFTFFNLFIESLHKHHILRTANKFQKLLQFVKVQKTMENQLAVGYIACVTNKSLRRHIYYDKILDYNYTYNKKLQKA